MFSTQLYKDLSSQDIQVFAIHPGWIRTDMGGPHAAGAPEESAKGIIDLMERKTEVPEGTVFIDFKGQPMP